MSEGKKIEIEVLTGPLDGHVIELTEETEWTGSVGGLLSFPWDDELGQPQGRLVFEEDQWLIEPVDSPHGTYIVSREKRLFEKAVLQKGDLLRASKTWMIIKAID